MNNAYCLYTLVLAVCVPCNAMLAGTESVPWWRDYDYPPARRLDDAINVALESFDLAGAAGDGGSRRIGVLKDLNTLRTEATRVADGWQDYQAGNVWGVVEHAALGVMHGGLRGLLRGVPGSGFVHGLADHAVYGLADVFSTAGIGEYFAGIDLDERRMIADAHVSDVQSQHREASRNHDAYERQVDFEKHVDQVGETWQKDFWRTKKNELGGDWALSPEKRAAVWDEYLKLEERHATGSKPLPHLSPGDLRPFTDVKAVSDVRPVAGIDGFPSGSSPADFKGVSDQYGEDNVRSVLAELLAASQSTDVSSLCFALLSGELADDVRRLESSFGVRMLRMIEDHVVELSRLSIGSSGKLNQITGTWRGHRTIGEEAKGAPRAVRINRAGSIDMICTSGSPPLVVPVRVSAQIVAVRSVSFGVFELVLQKPSEELKSAQWWHDPISKGCVLALELGVPAQSSRTLTLATTSISRTPATEWFTLEYFWVSE